MPKVGKTLLLAAAGIACFLGALYFGERLKCLPYTPGSMRLDQYNFARPDLDTSPEGCYSIALSHQYRTYRLPKAETLRKITLGYSKMIADLMFVHTMGNLSWSEKGESFVTWAYNMGLSIAALHPKYPFPYYSIGTYLSFQKPFIRYSNDILEIGSRELPHDFNMPFYIAYNYYWEMGDRIAAAPYFAEACSRPNAPPQMCTLAGKLLLQAETDPIAVANMMAVGYCVNAEEFRAQIILSDFEKRVLPLIKDESERKHLTEWFHKKIEYCREKQEEKK
ncbi:MAG: hypothetical protein AB1405_09480 [Bdellovibrionota bacterium]